MPRHAVSMTPRTEHSRLAAIILRWTGRGLAAAALLFWGAFFVAHVWEWFLLPRALPPGRVIGIVALHALLLVGLVVGWRWERLGALLVIVAGAAFFTLAAGPRAPLFTACTSTPALLWLGASWLDSRPGGRGR